MSIKFGREEEVAEIVRLRRALAVGKLMLGAINKLEEIRDEDYVGKSRKWLKEELKKFRSSFPLR